MQNGIRALTGIPVFTYFVHDIVNEEQLEATYKLLESADYQRYVIGVSTDSKTIQEDNACGVKVDYDYSVLSVFKMEDRSGRYHKMLLMRDPKLDTEYKGPWNKDDENWD